MAFPTYYPPAYGGGYQSMNQHIPQAAPQPTASTNWVQGDAGAKAFMVAPGSSVILMDSESDHFYMKAVDMSGMPTLRKFSYKEVGNTAVPVGDFISRSEFDQFKLEIQSMLKPEVSDEQPL